ncbi:unnamed protein product [Ceratitis capitata]|uniref:(Mediterranean fruit fly) hypothetical protein n=1 Tax=Ceratitis capitata TaxID=7213 RepID=A0A811VHE5_CERCA|nr:unnamed protein product [Ceratitis capitata]
MAARQPCDRSQAEHALTVRSSKKTTKAQQATTMALTLTPAAQQAPLNSTANPTDRRRPKLARALLPLLLFCALPYALPLMRAGGGGGGGCLLVVR